MNSSDPNHQEIIIIKRVVMEEEGHHGGAWKIAFADFMTAMMALFLVLWLINAANEETKRAVASYFNPVKLVDRNRSLKGINEERSGPTSDAKENEAAKPEAVPAPNTPDNISMESPKTPTEEQFFSSPMEHLDAIAQAALAAQATLGAAPAQQLPSAQDPFADPFAPNFWDKTNAKIAEGAAAAATEANASKVPQDAAQKADAELHASVEEIPKAELHQESKEPIIKKLKEQIRQALEAKIEDAELVDSMIEVKATPEGILISVTDKLGHPMFEIGSAVPSAPIVFAVEAIAGTLLSETGKVHVFGHTDSRQYRAEKSGNWRLSTDRAKSTYFMLMRGGLSDDRIVEISGFSDRKLRNTADPLADENRRIEILLETK